VIGPTRPAHRAEHRLRTGPIAITKASQPRRRLRVQARYDLAGGGSPAPSRPRAPTRPAGRSRTPPTPSRSAHARIPAGNDALRPPTEAGKLRGHLLIARGAAPLVCTERQRRAYRHLTTSPEPPHPPRLVGVLMYQRDRASPPRPASVSETRGERPPRQPERRGHAARAGEAARGPVSGRPDPGRRRRGV